MAEEYSIKKLYVETVIALLFVCLLGVIFHITDIFDWWYEYTRAHEDWELDEISATVVALLLISFIMSVRHFFILSNLSDNLKNANAQLKLHEKERVHRQKMLALNNLAGGLAHEIKNALQPAIGLGPFVENCLKINNFEKEETYMKLILSSTEHAQNVVENILHFSQENSWEFECAEAAEVLEYAIKFSRDIMPTSVVINQSGFDEIRNKDRKMTLECNRTGVCQIFNNLFINACYAMGDKGQIDVTATETTMPDHKNIPAICIEVADSGEGMSPDVLENIFDPFFTTKDVSQGTGLGLSTVYAIIKEHGGYVKAESQKGKGSTFSLFFPILVNPKKVK
jgi:signal transduction histidine kinase